MKVVPPVGPVGQAATSRPHSGLCSTTALSSTRPGSSLPASSLGEGGSRTLPSREAKQPPPGSFGAGGWASGGQGKYPQQSFQQCERTRLEFRKLMIGKYGTVVGAWRKMDANNDGKLSFFEFMRACRSMDVAKGARRLWAALDLDRSGFVSLAEVDPELAQQLGTLAVTIWSAFGTVERAWRHCFNRRGTLRVAADEFVRACGEIQFQGDALAAFLELSSDRASTGLTREEFGFLHHWISNGEPDRVGSEEPESRWAKEVQPWLPPVARPRTPQNVKHFKELLLKSYQNFVRAWRQGLDRDHNGQLEYNEFKIAVKDVGFAGNPMDLWKELDVNGNGVVSLFELDQPTASLLKHFNDCAINSHRSLENAWGEVMDTRFDDRVKLEAFREGCRAMGYDGNIEQLFDLLDVDRSKFLSWSETAWVGGEVAENDEQVREDLGMVNISGKYKKLTRLQQRRADINSRNHRLRVKKFEGRARGEIPGTNPAAGTTIFSPGVTFNSRMQQSSSSPALLGASPSSTASSFKGFRAPIEEPELPTWLLLAEGRVKSPEPKKKVDLSFPMKPQSPGKGGWPCRKLTLVDKFWGGSKDLGELLSPLSRKACTQHNLSRWRQQSVEPLENPEGM